MLAGLRTSRPNGTGLSSRKAMLETLVSRLNMVRLSASAFALVAMAGVGCTGLIDDGSSGLTDEAAAAKKAWIENASPVLTTNCVSCHNGSRPNIDFLSGADAMGVHDRLIAYTPAVVNLDAPGSSRLLTKGLHDGPALLAADASAVLEWIQKEKDAQAATVDPGGGPVLETAQFIPAICTAGTPPAPTCPVNDVDLTSIGLAGAKIHFVAQALGSGLYLNQLSVVAATDGAYIEHPLFASWPTDGSATRFDTIDRFFNIKMNLMANATEMIGGGTAAFIGFNANDKISIHFKVVKPFQPDAGGGGGGGGTGGCKVLPSFKTNAQALFTTAVGGAGQSCLSCHGGQNNNATSAMNITGVNAADDATILLACNQIKTRINTTDPNQSGVLLAADPANNNHPFRFTAAQLGTFKNGPPGSGLLGWINAEKIAP